MASLFHFSPIISTLFLITSCIASNQTPKPYIVYMGSPLNNSGDSAEIAELSHLRMLSSIIPSEESERISVRHSYNHAYRGFCSLLTEDEAILLSGHEEVVSVFPDPVLQLHTTRSWDFLGLESSYYSRSSGYHYKHGSSFDVIIGVIDTGIWPESPSFDDQHIGKVPSRWKGVCMEGFDFYKSNCNRKLIGARFYNIEDQESTFTKLPNISTTIPSKPNGTPRDKVGHGTNTASIAAGAIVPNANYYGLANGTARGGLPSARIATYKACSEGNCQGSAILKAIDDAIKDGVDIISISIGRSFVFQTDFKDDPIAIGAFHAAERGVVVVCSAGNEGPDPYTVTNSAPWIFTVAASTIDRKFQSTIVLGNNVSLKGSGISYNPTGRSRSRTYPLAFGENIPFHPSLTSQARNCMPGSLDAKRVAGKIIVCMNDDWTISREIKKLVVQDANAKGLILIDEAEKRSPFDSGNFPFAEVGKLPGAQILQYINSSQNPLATIFPANEIRRFKPAPVVADFSSRGPATLTENILKPDISAPGVGILSAMIPKVDEVSSNLLPEKKSTSLFGITSGTSMACPHVTGAMSFIKSIHRTWSFSMIKSAIMTTATVSNNLRKHLTNTSGLYSNPHEIGAGELSPIKALDPGLVFETTMTDYYNFLCYYGYKEKQLRLVASKNYKNFDCPRNASTSKKELISNINYPSISIEKLKQNQGVVKVKRVATNVGSDRNATYTSSTIAPPGLVVRVSPKKIVFVKGIKKASFEISFDGKKASKGYNFGIITWSDGSHKVQMIFAVNIE
ncbi:CO(2)-response secreted protease-like [Nicotiana tomentosiformis]|uniref:CO(2)-response secreted protease-like n=1 Tax=Nicotiana tomentosiformis TaxID=4098 RepID=UPI00051B6237|nr:CO(2)-response secreted protease-like isoform X1 [Nicotiana tomentosiformis]XP_033513335.1 CO(2)-response secreted protease-like isoform X2 [Nicotiana tomentosiformis]